MNPQDRISSAVREIVAQYERDKSHGRIYRNARAMLDQALIDAALKRCMGNQSRTALLLGIDRNSLRTKLLRHKVKL